MVLPYIYLPNLYIIFQNNTKNVTPITPNPPPPEHEPWKPAENNSSDWKNTPTLPTCSKQQEYLQSVQGQDNSC